MEERRMMEFFVEDAAAPSDDYDLVCFYLEDDRHLYAGRDFYVDGKKITYYIRPTGNHEALLFFYINDDVFDQLVDTLDDNTIDAYSETWPLVMRALKNGADDNYHECALIKLPKVHDAGWFWCFATNIENVDFADLDTEYVLRKMASLYQKSVSALIEFAKNDISAWQRAKAYGKAGYEGYNTTRKLVQGAKIAAGLLGAVFGVDLTGLADS